MPATPEPGRRRAFGLEIEASFPAAGLPEATGPAEGPRTRVTVIPEREIDERWHARAATTRLLEERLDDARDAARSIDHAPGVGYRLFARHFGVALVSDDGAEVRCAPPELEPWSWQRFLVGRVLPWAAVLRGREVFHASAVTVGGRALAMVGASGAGKTSLAAHLIDGGARCLTDDVLALDGDGEDGAIRAHPGVGILCVRTAEREAMVAQGRWDALGVVLGDSGKTYVEVEREPSAVPLAAVYFLSRRPGAAGVERIERPDARLLLGSTFVESLQAPGRLRRQLELCADLAARVPMFRVAVAHGDAGAARLARELRDHAERLVLA